MANVKMILNGAQAISTAEVGSIERHFGHDFIVQEDRSLVANMDTALADAEKDSGRYSAAQDAPPVETEVPAKPKPKGKAPPTTEV